VVWRRLALTGVLASVGTLSGGAAASAAVSRPPPVKASQALVQLQFEHQAYRGPRTGARLGVSVPARTPLTGEPTALPVIGDARTAHRRWLHVMLPGRPNGRTGWIEQGGTRLRQTGWHIVVSLSRRHVWVYFEATLVKSFEAVVGKPSTPTPTGSFFVEETEIMPSTEAGGPYALALSARSNVLQDFDGGPGQIGIHGRDLLGGTLGHAQSHGCVRLATPAITWLAARIGPGVPVTIDR
jgi:L,D-transpeptidase catalytic domain